MAPEARWPWDAWCCAPPHVGARRLPFWHPVRRQFGIAGSALANAIIATTLPRTIGRSARTASARARKAFAVRRTGTFKSQARRALDPAHRLHIGDAIAPMPQAYDHAAASKRASPSAPALPGAAGKKAGSRIEPPWLLRRSRARSRGRAANRHSPPPRVPRRARRLRRKRTAGNSFVNRGRGGSSCRWLHLDFSFPGATHPTCQMRVRIRDRQRAVSDGRRRVPCRARLHRKKPLSRGRGSDALCCAGCYIGFSSTV